MQNRFKLPVESLKSDGHVNSTNEPSLLEMFFKTGSAFELNKTLFSHLYSMKKFIENLRKYQSVFNWIKLPKQMGGLPLKRAVERHVRVKFPLLW